jgi:glutamyl-tRNA synthetase
MLDDLVWLGLDWDEGPGIGGPFGSYFQSARHAMYEAALAHLREQNLIYPCYCSRAKLHRLASAPQLGEDAPHYPGTCRNLTSEERRKRESAGERASLRFRAPETPIRFIDTISGEQFEPVADVVGDFVVQRSDGIIAYQLAVVVDDALMGISQVVRGADLLGSTARQLALYDAMGYPRPREYAHVPLLYDMSGERLAKRDASEGLEQVRNSGISSEHVLGALAASAGFWSVGMPATIHELLASFDVAQLRNTTYSLVV